MRRFLTAETLFAEVLLHKGHRRTVVLVEGPDDVNALEPHIANECVLIPGHGRTNVEGAVVLVDAESVSGVLAILDRDLVGILDDARESENVVYTDLYDLDATILMVGSVSARLLANFCDRERMGRHLARVRVGDALDLIVRPAIAVAALRILSRRKGLGLRLRNFPIQEVTNLNDGKVSLLKLLRIAINQGKEAIKPHGIELTVQEVQTVVDEIGGDARCCSGHDMIRLLAAYMRKKWGATVGAEVVANAVRACLSYEDLTRTSLFEDVSCWARARGLLVWRTL